MNKTNINHTNFGKGKVLILFTVLMLIFILVPVLVVIIYSFNESSQVTTFTGFSLKWYEKALQDKSLWESIKNSLIIALINTVLSTILGTLIALALVKYDFRGKNIIRNLIYIPVVMPEIVFGVALLAFFILIKFTLGIVSVALAHTTFSISFVALIVMAKLKNFDFRLEEASLDLGASKFQTFFKITLPNIAPGIISGALFAFTLSIDDFIITFFTAGTGASTLPLKIYSLIKFSVTPQINAISTILILLTFFAITSVILIQRAKVYKKFRTLFLVVILLLFTSLVVYQSFKVGKSDEVNIFIWTEYLDPELIQEFENKYNIKVNLNYFSNNEELLAKLQMGYSGYDVIFPTDYMVEIMIKQGILSKLDTSKITNYSHINESFKRLPFDTTGNYYIPYAYGYAGIVYNSDVIKDTIDSWKSLWNSSYKGKIMMMNDAREVMMAGAYLLNLDFNTTSETDVKKIFELLKTQKPLLYKYESSVTQEFLANGSAIIAQTETGTALKLIRDRKNFEFIIPKEGTNMFLDNFAIPVTAPNRENAEKFINFMLDPQNTARNIMHVLYPMPNDKAFEYLPESFKENKMLFPTNEQMKRFGILKDLGEFNEVIDREWTRLMSY
ncbi:MAG: extracellular solute-binding protein [Ignavibacteriaceae bacterium]|nr:extracellular solute-binding protein [Ignavibacteriaceae bacterium]